MATLSIKESREFVIFQAFSQNDSYNAALDALEKYDRENPDRRIFASAEEKKAMRDSYLMFKEAEQIMERLNTILRQQLPAVSREVMKSATASTAINKANVGRMMALHARNVKALGKKMLQQGKETVHEQARVGKSGITGHSPYEKVISTEPTYKRNEDVVVERLLKERQEKQRA